MIQLELKGGPARAELMLRRPFFERWERIDMFTPSNAQGARMLRADFYVDRPGLHHYYFKVWADDESFFIGPPAGQNGGMGHVYAHVPHGFQLTAYEENTLHPLLGVNMYQIFPDRFYCSNKADVLPGIDYHKSMGRQIRIHEDWDERPEYLPLPGRQHYDPCDFYGGNLQGIIDKLPYIKSLGTDVIYLNPVFESPSNHRYNISDYKKIDPILGDAQTLRTLCQKAAQLGMRVMLDGVFSHTGSDSIYFNREGRYGEGGAYRSQQSPYHAWYTFYHFPEDYRGWWGFKTLPETKEEEPSFQRFVMEGEDSVLTVWARYGVTLWRLDVADELPGAFIQALSAQLKKLDPAGAVLGEVWEDASNKFSHGEQRQYCMGKELDSVMNYPLRESLIGFLCQRMTSAKLAEHIHALAENYPRSFFYSAMNLTSSHDVPRALTQLCGAPDRHSLSREQQASVLFEGERLERGKRLFRLMLALLYALPGSPCIYYGDEAGLQGMADPFNRGTYPWGQEDTELLQVVRATARIRAHQVFKTGRFFLCAAEDDVLAVVRYIRGGEDAFGNPAADALGIVAINRSTQPKEVCFDLSQEYEGYDGYGLGNVVYYDEEYMLGKEGLHVENGWCRVLLQPESALGAVGKISCR
jgi:cyclomaltodextrinase